MKLCVGYWVCFDVDIPDEEFNEVYTSDKNFLEKGAAFHLLAEKYSQDIEKVMYICDNAEIMSVFDTKGEAYWEG